MLRVNYRKRLLQAVEAFLEGTPSALIRAHQIIQRCNNAIHNEKKILTIDWVIWGAFLTKLSDSLFYKNEEFLRETREMLLGYSSKNIANQVLSDDCRSCFTSDEAEWYTQLVSMVDFLITIPFKKIHEATSQARQDKQSWETMLVNIPEVVHAEKIEEEYVQRKAFIEDIYARNPSPKNVGDETIYHLILREVTCLVTEIRVGKAAVYLGYPMLDGFYSIYRDQLSSKPEYPNIIGSLLWAKRSLEAVAGKGELFISWRLSKAPTFDADALIISLH